MQVQYVSYFILEEFTCTGEVTIEHRTINAKRGILRFEPCHTGTTEAFFSHTRLLKLRSEVPPGPPLLLGLRRAPNKGDRTSPSARAALTTRRQVLTTDPP